MSPLLPPEQLITIARNCVRKYRNEQSSEFEDFRQEVLLGILERQMFFNPELGTVKRFVLTVAQQTAQKKPVIPFEKAEIIEAMNAGVRQNAYACELLAKGKTEGVARAEYNGHPCQIRMDWLNPDWGIVDLKNL